MSFWPVAITSKTWRDAISIKEVTRRSEEVYKQKLERASEVQCRIKDLV